MPKAEGTTNCATCGTLVYQTEVPTKKNGNCWRCEIKRLKKELAECKKMYKELWHNG